MNGKTNNVDWRTFILVLSVGTTILGVLWNAIIKTNDKIDDVQADITEIKVDASRTRAMLDVLITRINGGQITIIKNDEY